MGTLPSTPTLKWVQREGERESWRWETEKKERERESRALRVAKRRRHSRDARRKEGWEGIYREDRCRGKTEREREMC